tara:strand:- start:1148 stop:2233 length:1086 start_codon:yes stop_codon:yes gene_type:complete
MGKSGIGHVRWATHGAPTVLNAHPQRAGPVAVVHNGIVENFRELRAPLIESGYQFESETDTEVIAVLVKQLLDQGASPFDAATDVIRKLTGAFGLAFLFEGENDLIVAARKGAPMAIGIGDGEMFVASDTVAVGHLSNKIIYLEEGDIAFVSRESLAIYDANGDEVQRTLHIVDIDTEGDGASSDHTNSPEMEKQNRVFEIEKVRSVTSENSVSIYLNLIALEEQIGGFIERVRGSNSLDPDQKDKYLTFLVQVQKNIGDLSSSLPDAGEELSPEEVEEVASYLEKYWAHLKGNIGEYLAPDRTAGLTVPLGIVAISTGVGAVFGQPLVGSFVGAWLAGKIGPEKVVGKLLEGQFEAKEAS